VYEAVMANKGHMLVTADHGNVEQMQDYQSGQVHTQHTTELVPFIYVGPTNATIAEGGVLADVAPTLLTLMHIPVPTEMQGRNLITLES
jgi:Phosphoglyceromutase